MNTRPEPKGEIELELGRRFRREREEASITLADMAAKLRVSINTVRWHEAGARCLRADDVVRAAGFMGCEPSHLVQDRPVEELPEELAEALTEFEGEDDTLTEETTND